MMLFTHTTGIHYTDEIVEWAVLRKNRKGTEKIREGSLPVPEGFFQQETRRFSRWKCFPESAATSAAL